jgi:hypothetical protein
MRPSRTIFATADARVFSRTTFIRGMLPVDLAAMQAVLASVVPPCIA